jgi:hypothetical protein
VSGRRPHAKTLRVSGGSTDGWTVSAFGPDGRPLGFVYRVSTGEVWLRDGDEFRLAPGASVEDGWIALRVESTEPPS